MDDALIRLSVQEVARLVQASDFRSSISIDNENELHRFFDPKMQDCGKYFKCGKNEKSLTRQNRINEIISLLVGAGVDPGLRRHSDNCTPVHLAVRRQYVKSRTVLEMLASPTSSLGFGKEFRSVITY